MSLILFNDATGTYDGDDGTVVATVTPSSGSLVYNSGSGWGIGLADGLVRPTESLFVEFNQPVTIAAVRLSNWIDSDLTDSVQFSYPVQPFIPTSSTLYQSDSYSAVEQVGTFNMFNGVTAILITNPSDGDWALQEIVYQLEEDEEDLFTLNISVSCAEFNPPNINAPDDGNIYGRRFDKWVLIPEDVDVPVVGGRLTIAGNLAVVGDVVSNLTTYTPNTPATASDGTVDFASVSGNVIAGPIDTLNPGATIFQIDGYSFVLGGVSDINVLDFECVSGLCGDSKTFAIFGTVTQVGEPDMPFDGMFTAFGQCLEGSTNQCEGGTQGSSWTTTLVIGNADPITIPKFPASGVSVAITSQSSGDIAWKSAGTLVSQLITCSYMAAVPTNTRFWSWVVPRPLVLQFREIASLAHANTAPSATTQIGIFRNNVQIGAYQFSSGSKNARAFLFGGVPSLALAQGDVVHFACTNPNGIGFFSATLDARELLM
jgi:hypothetical protein